MANYKGDVCVITGCFQDQNGNRKNRYNKIGAWFQDAQSGAISVKLDVLPMPRIKQGGQGEIEQACWLSLFESQPQGGGNNQGGFQGNGNGNNQQRPGNGNNQNGGRAYQGQQSNNNSNNNGGVPY